MAVGRVEVPQYADFFVDCCAKYAGRGCASDLFVVASALAGAFAVYGGGGTSDSDIADIRGRFAELGGWSAFVAANGPFRVGGNGGIQSGKCDGAVGNGGSEVGADHGGGGGLGVAGGSVRLSDSRGKDSVGVGACSDGMVRGLGGGTESRGVDVAVDGIGSGFGELRGKHWASNRRKKQKRREERGEYCGKREVPVWRGKAKADASGGCVSDESVVTVDTRTAERIEAEKTFDRRRAAENRVAEAMAKHRLTSLEDVDKTKAVRDLELARMHERINKANAASQAAYAKCSDSLKSIGSAGSAGEMYFKREIAKAKDNEKVLAYVKAQAEVLSREASPETLARVSRIPPPVFDSHEELLDCPDDADEDMIIANEFAFNEAMAERDDGCMFLNSDY